MADHNQIDFRGRLGRIEKIHNDGGGFEAAGALGMAHYNALKRRRRRPRLIGILVMTVAVVLFLKATSQVAIGQDVYAAKVKQLSKGDWADRAGAMVLRSDPVSDWLADYLRHYIG